MRIQKFKVLLYLKKGSTDKQGKEPIIGRITLNNSMALFSCKLSCTTNLWNPPSGRLDGKSREAVEVNTKVDKMLLNINFAYDNLLKRNVNITAQSIKELMQGDVECQVTLIQTLCGYGEAYWHRQGGRLSCALQTSTDNSRQVRRSQVQDERCRFRATDQSVHFQLL